MVTSMDSFHAQLVTMAMGYIPVSGIYLKYKYIPVVLTWGVKVVYDKLREYQTLLL